ncbi:MAG: hypothetical protein QOG34_489, partial [Frankiaceae bacterium]|nr:hypothetical protein [Frankiaceae bacterium]
MRAALMPRRARFGYATLAVLLAGYAASTLLRPSGWHSTLLDNGVTNAIQVGAAVLCLVRARTVPLLRGAWAAFGAGLLIWSAGDVYWTLEFGGGSPPGPSLADVGYLAFYPLAYVGLVLVIRSRATRFPPALWWDGVIVALGAAAIAATFGYDAIVSVSSGAALTIAINICYPIGDLILVAIAAAMLTLFRGQLEARWILLAVGSVIAGIADIVYLMQTAHSVYVEGTYLDALWPAAILAMSFAGWLVPRRSERVRMDGTLMLVAPLGAAATAGGLLIYGNVLALDPVALVLAGAALVAAGIRMALGFHDLHSLHQTRVLAHTDELTQLSNRRHFLNRLDAALAEAASGAVGNGRLAVLFIDLDRFKEVNDAFGHQIGDE